MSCEFIVVDAFSIGGYEVAGAVVGLIGQFRSESGTSQDVAEQGHEKEESSGV